VTAYVAVVTAERQWFEGPFPVGEAVDVAEKHRFEGRSAEVLRLPRKRTA
jgi:hypothetical protein